MEEKNWPIKKIVTIIILVVVILSVISLLFNQSNSFGFVIFIVVFGMAFTFGVYRLGNRVNVESDPAPRHNFILDEESDIPVLKDTKVCPVCHTENIINRKYCKKCQTNIQNKVCPVCDNKNPHSAKYCANCDSILQNSTRH